MSLSNIFPYVLDMLSNKPFSSDTQSSLLKELNIRFKNEDLKTNNLKKKLEEALEIGEDLGIFQIKEEKVRLLSAFKSNKEQPTTSRSNSVPAKVSDKAKANAQKATDAVRSSRQRRSRSSGRRQSRSRSGTRSRSRSQRRGRGSRRRRM